VLTSLAALGIALEGAEEAGATTELLDIKQLSLPMYDPADTHPPHSVLKMCDRIHAAAGLIWSSPMYKGTITGSFKNALDWLKLLGDRSMAGGALGLQGVNTMEFVVRALRGWSVPLVMPIAQAWKAFDEYGIPQDSQLTEQLHAVGREVTRGSWLEPPTEEDAARAEAEIGPLSDGEAKSS